MDKIEVSYRLKSISNYLRGANAFIEDEKVERIFSHVIHAIDSIGRQLANENKDDEDDEDDEEEQHMFITLENFIKGMRCAEAVTKD